MSMPRLLQLALVWARLRIHETTEIRGIQLVGHPTASLSDLCAQLEEALDQVASVDPVTYGEILRSMRMIIVTERFRNILLPDGICFLPRNAPALGSTRRLGGWAVWAAAYIGECRQAECSKSVAKAAEEAACKARQQYYRGLDLAQLAIDSTCYSPRSLA